MATDRTTPQLMQRIRDAQDKLDQLLDERDALWEARATAAGTSRGWQQETASEWHVSRQTVGAAIVAYRAGRRHYKPGKATP